MTLRFAVLTVSDRSSAGAREDASGPALTEKIEGWGWQVAFAEIVPDERQAIADFLIKHADVDPVDVILTTGGTGFSPRDITPEATKAVIERDAPGLTEAMRANSLAVTKHALLSRAVAGIRKNTLIVNLPGSPKGAVENLEVILPVLPHAVALLGNDPGAEAGHRE